MRVAPNSMYIVTPRLQFWAGVANPHPADPILPSAAPCSEFGSAQVVIPQPLLDLTTRRVLTMEWVTGVKLTTLEVG